MNVVNNSALFLKSIFLAPDCVFKFLNQWCLSCCVHFVWPLLSAGRSDTLYPSLFLRLPGSNSKFRKEILKSAVSIESVAHKNWFRWYKWRQVQDKWISVHQAPHLCTEGMKPVEFWFHWIRLLLLLLLLLLEGKKKQTGFRGLLFLTEKLLCSEILIA